ncbi:MAPEG family protein [Sphingomonas rosea]|uniref:MAPEG family protein n=1 Tax=Sphingomonas rosea TaxID=335605 RepID=A0ABP7UE25_9SPHN
MTDYPLTAASLLLACAIFFWAMFLVGRARGKYQVQAPAVTGAPEFERVFRAQQNTVEQMIVFVPLLALAAAFWGDKWGAVYGLVWCAGRFLYITTYAADAQKRAVGFMVTALSSMLVLAGLAITLLLRFL